MDFLIELVFPFVILGMTNIGTGSEAETDDAELYDPTKTVYPGNNIYFDAIVFFSPIFQSNIEHTHASSV